MDKINSKLKISDSVIPGKYWDITKSGKVLELRVRPTIDQKPEKYRFGVIQIGRLISRIQSLTEDSNSSPQIQLFPNLAESQLAATIYCPDLLDDIPQEDHKRRTDAAITVSDIEQLAAHYNLYTEKCDDNQSASESGQVLKIISHSNQPFIWLKVGQFIQDLTDRISSLKNRAEIAIDINRTYKPERSTSERSVTYQQMTLTLPRRINHED